MIVHMYCTHVLKFENVFPIFEINEKIQYFFIFPLVVFVFDFLETFSFNHSRRIKSRHFKNQRQYQTEKRLNLVFN